MNSCCCWYNADNIVSGKYEVKHHIFPQNQFFSSTHFDTFDTRALYQYICTSRFATVQSDDWYPGYLVVKYFYVSTAYDIYVLVQNIYELFCILAFLPPWKTSTLQLSLLSDLEKKCVLDELCAIFWEFLHWHIFWTERICSQVLTHELSIDFRCGVSIARLKYDLQLHLIHFPPFHEIGDGRLSQLKK